MKVRRKREASAVVIWSVLGLMLAGMGLLIGELWQLQVMNNRGFEEVGRNQSVRRVRLPAIRGKIYDTNDACLADSVPNLLPPEQVAGVGLQVDHPGVFVERSYQNDRSTG